MDPQEMYDLVYDAVRQAVTDHDSEPDTRLLRRFEEGKVIFQDAEGKTVKELPASMAFKKITSIREKLRVLEQKLNNHASLSQADKAELQVYISRCYGSLTTFNFLFANETDKFHS